LRTEKFSDLEQNQRWNARGYGYNDFKIPLARRTAIENWNFPQDAAYDDD
jgi:hypothetical protein